MNMNLSQREKEILLLRLGDLLKFLNTPGDWGYETRLGKFTIDAMNLRNEIAEQVPKDAA